MQFCAARVERTTIPSVTDAAKRADDAAFEFAERNGEWWWRGAIRKMINGDNDGQF